MESTIVNLTQLSADYLRIEVAIRFLEIHHDEQISLREVAQSVHLSEYHFQRLFTRWVGISPKRFMQYLTKEHAKQLLRESESVLDVAIQSGLSSPGRLHDLFVTCEAVTPGEYKQRGEGLSIYYGFHPSPFGECLLAITERGICNLFFLQNGEKELALEALREDWPRADLREDPKATRPIIEQVYGLFKGDHSYPLRLYLSGTNFQLKVWEALLQIPPGTAMSYEDVAVYIGMPGTARAVSNAIGRNSIAVIIPCHRVIRKTGEMGGYRWGNTRKKALLGWEAAQLDRGQQRTDIMVNA